MSKWSYHHQLRKKLKNTWNTFFGQPGIPNLSEEERPSCEGRISIEECVRALDTFESGKTPGNDGIPIEFYKTFWSCVGELMTHVFNYSFDSGEMSNSQKQAIITLIDKKGLLWDLKSP